MSGKWRFCIRLGRNTVGSTRSACRSRIGFVAPYILDGESEVCRELESGQLENKTSMASSKGGAKEKYGLLTQMFKNFRSQNYYYVKN